VLFCQVIIAHCQNGVCTDKWKLSLYLFQSNVDAEPDKEKTVTSTLLDICISGSKTNNMTELENIEKGML